jgi:LCP family protein required for cell wall assembly
VKILRVVSFLVVASLALLSAATLVAWWWAERQFEEIPTFDEVPPSASQGPTTTMTLPAPSAQGISTYLVFGVGSQGLDATDAERLRIGMDRVEMADGLTDAIALVIVDATMGKVLVVSLPRDTWLDDRSAKLNSVYVTDGPQAFADEVTALTGVPVNHMVAVNFAAVADVVDALGGVQVESGAAMRDPAAGLDVPAGCVTLDGPAALALSRARHVEYFDGARWRTDPSGDFGRIRRTQQLTGAVVEGKGWAPLVTSIPALLDTAGENLTRDSALTLDELVALGRSLSGGAELLFWAPPATPTRVGKASVVVWDPEAGPVLARIAAAVTAGALTGAEIAPETVAPTEPTPTPVPAGPDSATTAPPAPELRGAC